MAKKAYIGVNNVAHKIKKGYIGVDGVARKIKKAYIGIGGVARPCWSGGEIAYYGAITDLDVARCSLAAATTGNYALFAGGGTGSKAVVNVDAYDKSLVHSTVANALNWGYSSYGVADLAGGSIGDYALFLGGYRSQGSTQSNYVTAYNSSLTRSEPKSMWTGKYEMGITRVGNYLIIAGGTQTGDMCQNVEAYDTSLTWHYISYGLTAYRHLLAGGTVGNYALFAGGRGTSGGSSAIVESYDSSLTKTTVTELSVGRRSLASASIGNYVLFAGGVSNYDWVDTVDAFDPSLTRSIATSLSNTADELAGTTLGDYALFAGGDYSSSHNKDYKFADSYDASLTKKTVQVMNTGRHDHVVATIGNYAIFAGGTSFDGVVLSSVEAYTVV